MRVRSMTGFGQGRAGSTDRRITVELRGVNNRFCDLRFRMPTELSAWEGELRRHVQRTVRRGRVEISIAVEPADEGELRPTVNLPLMREALDLARRLATDHGLSGKLEVGTLVGLPGMFKFESTTLAWDDAQRTLLLQALDAALERFDADRRREGQLLCEELLARLARMSEHAVKIRDGARDLPATLRDKLLRRLEGLSSGVDLDPTRLAQEATFLADRSDVTEELVRLEGHLQQARALLSADDGEPLGKRLDFLFQEISREVNTLCSKIGDLELTRGALAIKLEAEKVREQVQNLE